MAPSKNKHRHPVEHGQNMNSSKFYPPPSTFSINSPLETFEPRITMYARVHRSRTLYTRTYAHQR